MPSLTPHGSATMVADEIAGAMAPSPAAPAAPRKWRRDGLVFIVKTNSSSLRRNLGTRPLAVERGRFFRSRGLLGFLFGSYLVRRFVRVLRRNQLRVRRVFLRSEERRVGKERRY